MGYFYDFQCTLISFLILAIAITMARGQGTRIGFYGPRCPNVESIVRTAVQTHFRSDPTIAPSILRMHFHDCFVQGCDGSILIAGANSERTAGPNLALKGFEAIDDAKTQLEVACPGIVSCADVLALAAREAVVFTGGLTWAVPLGRRDGTISQASEAANLPGPFDSVAVQKQKFAAKNLNTQDLVALVGGHTIGTAGCGVFRNRFFNFNSTGGPDPTIDPSFVSQVQALCPLAGDAARRVALDTGSENRFDTSFFSNVRSGRGILQSDQVLWNDPETRTIIQRFLGIRGLLGLRFGAEFARSMVKMSNIEVKTGAQGEIRRVCSAVNS